MRKIYNVNLTWPRLIIFAIIMGVYTATVAMVPSLLNTSFHDISVSFEVWIFIGIFIIMNSKSAKDSALKCFIFFLISQPLVYILQDIINHSNLLFLYYRNWIGWTIFCIPMGYIGYYMKKDKIWGLAILTPMLLFTGLMYGSYLSSALYMFPYHILTALFCIFALLFYPLNIFKNKTNKKIGLIISVIILVGTTLLCFVSPNVYSTDILSNDGDYKFDNTYKAYLEDSKYGDLSIKCDSDGFCLIHAEFKKGGKTKLIIESPEGEKKVYKLDISYTKFDREEVKQ